MISAHNTGCFFYNLTISSLNNFGLDRWISMILVSTCSSVIRILFLVGFGALSPPYVACGAYGAKCPFSGYFIKLTWYIQGFRPTHSPNMSNLNYWLNKGCLGLQNGAKLNFLRYIWLSQFGIGTTQNFFKNRLEEGAPGTENFQWPSLSPNHTPIDLMVWVFIKSIF